jgi:hypothetical protein
MEQKPTYTWSDGDESGNACDWIEHARRPEAQAHALESIRRGWVQDWLRAWREPESQELKLKERELREQRERQQRELDLREQELKDQRAHRQEELALKKQELELQGQQKWLSPWNTPVVLAIVAGLLGYLGTLISGCQGRDLEREKHRATLEAERQKQEGTLILDAIKTAGTAAEKEKRTAANLVFLADAGLITSIPKEELEKLRSKAGDTGPSLPAVQGVEFSRSGALTADLQARLQRELLGYQTYLGGLGYDPGKARDRVVVRVEDSLEGNAYFDSTSVVVDAHLARDPDYVLSEYTWYVLKELNQETYQAFATALQLRGFGQGLKFYFTCSYRNDALVGKNYYSLIHITAPPGSQGYLFNLDQRPKFDKTEQEEHKLGEIWGSAFWELRKQLGPEKADKIVMTAWKQLKPTTADLDKLSSFVNVIVEASKPIAPDTDPQRVRQVFEERNLR